MRRLILVILLLSASVSLRAQLAVRPEFRVRFVTALLNSEFDASDNQLATSGTIGVIRLNPYVGISFNEKHRLMGGVMGLKYFGSPDQKLTVEGAVWYQYDTPKFTFAGGIFPRSILKGNYSTAILSDAKLLVDGHLDGFLLQWHPGRSHYEIALDWNGRFGQKRREQFNVITYGQGYITRWFSLGWEGMFHHYASSVEAPGVVDDHILHAFAKADFSSYTGLQQLYIQAGAMGGYHRNRVTDQSHYPLGVNIDVAAMKWNFGLRNQFYYGGSQAPFYKDLDTAGQPFGSDLYMRSSFWQIRTDGASAGYYDRVDLFWQRSFGAYVNLVVQLRFYFGQGGYVGNQQLIKAVVNLDKITFKKRK